MPKYMTEQRRKLIEFLRAHPDRLFSAREIAAALASEGVSVSAVYRNLGALEEEGQITGVTKEGTRDRFYRCLLSDRCRECIHMTCLKCGRTLHLDAGETQKLLFDTAAHSGFRISAGRSVLYGLCSECDEPEKRA